MGEGKDIWAERVRLFASCQVSAGLMLKARNPAENRLHTIKAVLVVATLGLIRRSSPFHG